MGMLTWKVEMLQGSTPREIARGNYCSERENFGSPGEEPLDRLSNAENPALKSYTHK